MSELELAIKYLKLRSISVKDFKSSAHSIIIHAEGLTPSDEVESILKMVVKCEFVSFLEAISEGSYEFQNLLKEYKNSKN